MNNLQKVMWIFYIIAALVLVVIIKESYYLISVIAYVCTMGITILFHWWDTNKDNKMNKVLVFAVLSGIIFLLTVAIIPFIERSDWDMLLFVIMVLSAAVALLLSNWCLAKANSVDMH